MPTGTGETALLLDSGIGPGVTLGGRLLNLAEQPEGSASAHGSRIASLCAEGEEAAGLYGAPCGIAPSATILSAAHRAFAPDRWPDIASALRRHTVTASIIGLPWSAMETHWLAHAGRAQFAALMAETGTLLVAAAGHDGPGSLRFPATCPFALSVGVHGPDALPVAYCGTDEENRKPELLVPDLTWPARLESGELSSINGTSAAVAVVVGLGLLWCERLRALGHRPVPALLKAALLAAAAPSPKPHFRLVPLGAAFPSGESLLARRCGGSTRFDAEATGGAFRLCVVAETPATLPRQWIYTPPRVAISVRCGTGTWSATGAGWCALDLELPIGGFEIRVDLGGEGATAFLLGIGARAQIRPGPRDTVAKRPFTVVGISASQSGSACVLRDGKLQYAIQLERITRRKRDGEGFLRATEAIDYCLDAAGLRAGEVDLFAFNSQPLLPGWVGLSQPSADELFEIFDHFGERSRFVSHHLAHAFATYAAAGLPSAAVLVCDGSGGSTLGPEDLVLSGPALRSYLESPASMRPPVHVSSIYRFEGRSFTLLERETAESFNVRCGSSSIGEAYAAVSQYLFHDWQEGGKLMGLAAYGDPEAAGVPILERGPDGRLHMRRDWQNRYRSTRNANPMDPQNRNLAARVQLDLETAVLDRVRRALDLSSEKDLAYSGGLALNCAANRRILQETPVRSLFVFPASNDAGIAVGAAWAALAGERSRPFQPARWGTDFRGYAYTPADIDVAIREWRPWLQTSPCDAREVAERIAQGQILACFDGGSEFGPRALGHRSILADPRHRAIRDRINRDVKHREDFRPFAPVVPVERVADYFELESPSPYMLLLARVRPEYRDLLAAVSHEDGTARVQTVDASEVPRLHELLCAFASVTGLPVLLNTSLNVRGQPIVETPLQAIELLLSTRLDGLLLGDTFVELRRGSLLDGSSYVALSPAARVVCESNKGRPLFFVESSVHRDRFELPPAIFQILSNATGNKTIDELIRESGSAAPPVAQLALLEALSAERIVLGRPGEPG